MSSSIDEITDVPPDTMDNVRYTLEHVSRPVAHSADPWAKPWCDLNTIAIDNFPWYSHGKKQRTTVAACWSAQSLHVLFECEDIHIGALAREPNGPVCRDSCVEFFIAIHADLPYINLEINCCGDIHLGFGKARKNRDLAAPQLISLIKITTTVDERPKREHRNDDGWNLQVELPFQVIQKLYGHPVYPGPGDRWRGNFYRCGGFTDPQHACWAPIPSPRPNFHLPEHFGTLVFGD